MFDCPEHSHTSPTSTFLMPTVLRPWIEMAWRPSGSGRLKLQFPLANGICRRGCRRPPVAGHRDRFPGICPAPDRGLGLALNHHVVGKQFRWPHVGQAGEGERGDQGDKQMQWLHWISFLLVIVVGVAGVRGKRRRHSIVPEKVKATTRNNASPMSARRASFGTAPTVTAVHLRLQPA